MTNTEMLWRIHTGYLLLVGEVRAADVREDGYVDKKTGLTAKSVIVTYVVELPRGEFKIAKVTKRVVAVVTDLAQVPVGAEKGGRYAFEIESMEWKPGFLHARMAPAAAPQAIEEGAPPLGAPQGASAAVA